MTPLEILRKARDLISDPQRWSRNYYATRSDNAPCGETAEEACKWCAMGAITKVGWPEAHFDVRVGAKFLLADKAKDLFGMGIIDVNEKCGHAAVLKCFDSAIASLTTPQEATPC